MKTTIFFFIFSIAFLACNNGSTNTQATTQETTNTTSEDPITIERTSPEPINPPPATEENTNTVNGDTVPGNKIPAETTDENGCRISQGEQWSMLRKSCIKLAETDIRMEPKQGAPDRSKPAYLLFSEDKVRVEIFLPTQKKTVVIRKSTVAGNDDKWINGPLTITKTDDGFALYDEGKLLYQGVKKD
jgi:hypothetical protein